MKSKVALIGKGKIRKIKQMIYQRRWANKILTPKFTHSEEDKQKVLTPELNKGENWDSNQA